MSPWLVGTSIFSPSEWSPSYRYFLCIFITIFVNPFGTSHNSLFTGLTIDDSTTGSMPAWNHWIIALDTSQWHMLGALQLNICKVVNSHVLVKVIALDIPRLDESLHVSRGLHLAPLNFPAGNSPNLGVSNRLEVIGTCVTFIQSSESQNSKLKSKPKLKLKTQIETQIKT